jgi:hypothetical protein
MCAKEAEGPFLEKVVEYLVSLPFDLKILQEAVTDPDLSKESREMAAGTIIHTIMPQEGDLTRFVDDVFLVRAALDHIVRDGGESATAFRDRFPEIYENLGTDLKLFESCLGELWPWLTSKLPSFSKLPYKGKKPPQYCEDEEGSTQLYDEGLEFQTNYNVNEQQVRNKLRRVEQITELLGKRRADDLKKKA